MHARQRFAEIDSYQVIKVCVAAFAVWLRLARGRQLTTLGHQLLTYVQKRADRCCKPTEVADRGGGSARSDHANGHHPFGRRYFPEDDQAWFAIDWMGTEHALNVLAYQRHSLHEMTVTAVTAADCVAVPWSCTK